MTEKEHLEQLQNALQFSGGSCALPDFSINTESVKIGEISSPQGKIAIFKTRKIIKIRKDLILQRYKRMLKKSEEYGMVFAYSELIIY